jgi:hypothetical protein
MNQYRMSFVQNSTLPPSMHHKLTKHGKFCKQNNQLPTKSHDELENNSIIFHPFLAMHPPRFTIDNIQLQVTTNK